MIVCVLKIKVVFLAKGISAKNQSCISSRRNKFTLIKSLEQSLPILKNEFSAGMNMFSHMIVSSTMPRWASVVPLLHIL